MLYDKHVGPADPDTPLETIFMLVWLQRQQQQLMATQALIAAVRAGDTKEANEAVIKAFDEYCEKMFPFFQRATDTKLDEQKKALQEFVQKPLRIKMSDIYASQARTLKKINKTIHRRAKGAVATRPTKIPDRFRTRPR